MEDLVLFVDGDGIDDMREVLHAVKKKYQKMDVSVIVETDDEKLTEQLNSEESVADAKDFERQAPLKKRPNSISNVNQDEDMSQCDQSQTGNKKKKLNSRLQRLYAEKNSKKKKKVKKFLIEAETSSNDSGIDMTDMMKTFDEQVTNSGENDVSREQCAAASSSKNCKRKRDITKESDAVASTKKLCTGHDVKQDVLPPCEFDKSRIVALDCEFVGVGPGKVSALGRCSIVNYDGNVLCDIMALPQEPITDYRTRWSGIRRRDMDNAVPLPQALGCIKHILQDKIVVGHALHHDFRVLGFRHPPQLIRDTSKSISLHKMLREKCGDSIGNKCSLKLFTKHLLGRTIQTKEHCSIQDSVASLDLYKLVEHTWELYTGLATSEGMSSDHCYFDDSYWPDDVLSTMHY